MRCHVFGVSPHHLLRNGSVERLTVGGLISLPDIKIKNIAVFNRVSVEIYMRKVYLAVFKVFNRVYIVVKMSVDIYMRKVYLSIFKYSMFYLEKLYL